MRYVVREIFFADRTIDQSFDHPTRKRVIVDCDYEAVELEEDAHANEGRALVAVIEAMILRYRVAKPHGECQQIIDIIIMK